MKAVTVAKMAPSMSTISGDTCTVEKHKREGRGVQIVALPGMRVQRDGWAFSQKSETAVASAAIVLPGGAILARNSALCWAHDHPPWLGSWGRGLL